MSYKNDSLLVVANKYGAASGDAKAELYETYDKLRDLTVSGPTLGMPGYGAAGGFLVNLARLVSPSSFMPALGAGQSMNIPGTSFFSAISGGNSIVNGGQAAFGYGSLGTYPGFPSGGAAAIGLLGSSLLGGVGEMFSGVSDASDIAGVATGGAASVDTASSLLNGAGAVSGLSAGFGQNTSVILPTAGVIAGLGGLMAAVGPYFGPFGVGAGIAGNLASGYAGAVLNAYQSASTRILNNADTILSTRIRNIETVCKQLDTQSDLIRKALKDSMDGDSKAIQNI